jgi:predicted RNA-binding Zn ribbon-like protein
METPAHIQRQRIVGGDIALDLLNTQNGPALGAPEDDALRGYDDVVAWAHYVGVLSGPQADGLIRRAHRHPADARAVFERTLETRRSLYVLFSAVAHGSRPPDEAISNLQRDEAEALAHAHLVATGDAYEWAWRDDDLGRPLWPVIHAAARLLTDGPLDRVKGCATCRFHFIDESKNRSRRWCSMEDCGKADKMQKYVTRRAAARSSART